jgi:hypothetical protein
LSLRRKHTEAEIRALANHFQESWSDGQLIKSWLRVHAEELRALVKQEDWAWTNIGKALTYAGIRYQSGNQWTGENLRKEVIKACLPRQSRKPRTAQNSRMPPSLATYLDKYGPTNVGEPEFKIIQRRQQPDETAAPNLSQSPIPRRKLTDQEIRLIALGRSDLVRR